MSRTTLAAIAVLALVTACAPPGMTAVTYQGVTVLAPADWGRNQLRCGIPIRNTVVLNPPSAQEACMIVLKRPVDYVWLRSCTTCGADPEGSMARQAVRVSGRPARRGEERLGDGRTEVVLVVPDRDVVVAAVSVDPGVARGIVDSASIS